jgi:hypothetical protein
MYVTWNYCTEGQYDELFRKIKQVYTDKTSELLKL